MEAAAAGWCQRAVYPRQEEQARRRGRSRKPSCSSRSAACRWSWSGSKKSLSCSEAHELRKLVDHDHPELSISRQCVLLGLPRSTLYYRPTPVRESTLPIMARIDALDLEDPCSGSRRMVNYLAREGIPISRDRIRNLMQRMGLRAIYQKPRTTVPGDLSERFPCLVDLKQITAVDQVWATDITYIPAQKGFLYLVGIMDLHSRHVLSWKLSNSLDREFCLEALEMALSSGRRPEIFHSDQGCQGGFNRSMQHPLRS
jgi:putative transposase